MKVTIHQPEHLPWLGFFNKLSKADVFVILDSVQFEKNYFQHRNRIMGSDGAQWLSVPTFTTGHMNCTIGETRIATSAQPKWRKKYLNTIRASYGKHLFFKEAFDVLEPLISADTESLADLNVSIIEAFASRMGFCPTYVRSSSLGAEGMKSELILDICRKTNAETYIAGPSGRDYLDGDSFRKAGINVVFNDYLHPEYPQRNQTEFVSHLSSIDLLMNCGFEEASGVVLRRNEGVSHNW